MVSLDLTDEEAESFKDWRKYQTQFESLVEAGVFRVQVGKAVLHFRDQKLEQVCIETVNWRRT